MNQTMPKTVLLVDDDADFRELASQSLRQAGFAVAQAGGVRSALRAVGRIALDLAVVDGVLPEGSGRNLVARLRADGVDVPIVFVSAHIGRVGLPAGDGIRFLAKPMKMNTLVEVVRQLLTPTSQPHDEALDIDDLSHGYRAGLPGTLANLDERLRRARSGWVSELSELRDAAHKLRGSAGSHGLPEVGEAAGDLEDALDTIAAAFGAFDEPEWWEVTRAMRRAIKVAGG